MVLSRWMLAVHRRTSRFAVVSFAPFWRFTAALACLSGFRLCRCARIAAVLDCGPFCASVADPSLMVV